MEATVCALCRLQKVLQESHLLPAAAHRVTKDNGKNVLAMNRKGWVNRTNQRDFKEYLLCYDCEQDLSIYEGDAIKACRKAWEFKSSKPYKLPQDSVEALVRCAYSIFWRVSVSKTIEDYVLSSEVEEELRSAFYQRKYPEKLRLPISMSFIKIDGLRVPDRVLMTPWIERPIQSLRITYFTMFGIVFRMHLPNALFEVEPFEFLNAQDKSGIMYPLQDWETQGIDAMFTTSVSLARRVR